jgi:hypothetical protein
MMIEQ